VVDLLRNDYVKSGQIELYGYLNPGICLANLSPKRTPDVIVYDWEYGDTYAKSEAWLLELLGEIPNAFVFVYTGVRNDVPPHLNKRVFDKFARRFQLLEKGSSTDSVFSSEEFVHQYILSLVSKTHTISIGGLSVKFEENGYLDSPTDILYLESILGRALLLDLIKKHRNRISKNSIEKMVSSLNGHVLLNREKGFLITADYTLLDEKSRATEKVSYLEALKTFGVVTLKEAVENGFAKISIDACFD
jgi:hypothetical protein